MELGAKKLLTLALLCWIVTGITYSMGALRDVSASTLSNPQQILANSSTLTLPAVFAGSLLVGVVLFLAALVAAGRRRQP